MDKQTQFKYPGIPDAMDGNTAVIMCERESSDGAGAYPITPSTQMGEYWAQEAASGHLNVSGKPLIFIEPEGEHAAAAVTAGLSMTGLRATNFSSGQGIAYMHESLYAAVGKRLTYVLNMGCRAITKATLNVHAGHDDYHSIDDTGFFQLMAKDVQEAADLNIIAHRIAELALTPGIVGQDGFLTTHVIESLRVPERELIAEYLGLPSDIIDTPTPAQRVLFGDRRRRIPELWTVDNPLQIGTVQNQDSYMQNVAAQRPFFFAHIHELTQRAMQEFYDLTGRRYNRVGAYRCEDAEYILVGQGSVVANAEAVVDYLRKTRNIKIGVVNMTMFRPFPGDLVSHVLKGRKGVTVLERLDQPLAEDPPLLREIRAAMHKCLDNNSGKTPVYPGYASYTQLSDIPPFYAASFGMGSRDLQPEALIGAVENMLPDGSQRRLYYLSIDFIQKNTTNAKRAQYQKLLLNDYPDLAGLAIRGSENPNLMPDNSITVRIHSVGGWGAIATGKNLTLTLADILGYYVKANPKYGSEKKGQPTTYYLAVAPEPIKVNCEFHFVDAVLSPDPNVFKHSNPLSGLKKGGAFIIQSDLGSPEAVWKSIPSHYQKMIIANEYRIFAIDAFKIAKEEASDVELQFRMQGMAFQGCFFAAASVHERKKMSREDLFAVIENQLTAKFGKKSLRIVEDNMRVVKRGFSEMFAVPAMEMTQSLPVAQGQPKALMLESVPVSSTALTDVHRFWDNIASFYKTGQGNDNIADPFMGLGVIPASTGVFKDMTDIRFEHPVWIPENCTGCGSCWTVCPDTAIPGLVQDVGEVFRTAVRKMERSSQSVKYLKTHMGAIEERLRALINAGSEKDDLHRHLHTAVSEIVASPQIQTNGRGEAEREFLAFEKIISDFQFSVTRPFYTNPEKKSKGGGGLLAVTVNPYTCKGCMECVDVCNDNALAGAPQTEASVAKLKDNWEFWQDLPNTPAKYVRIENLDEGIGALETLLLDKDAYMSMSGGDGACLGCSEKTVLHLFTGTVTALMQPRVTKRVLKIETLLETLESGRTTGSITAEEKNTIIAGLKDLHHRYTKGATGNGRSSMGIVNSTGCTSVWGSTYPINPYPFPWTNHLFQDSTSMAMGLFEGHMAKMTEDIKIVRRAEAAMGLSKPEDLTYFNWEQFTDEEFHLCPPVVAVGGDGALYDIGFQNLSRMMMSGKPIKVLALDTQVYSNTGGQACTSGFVGQISDMAQYGKAQKGKSEIRKEIGLITMGHRTTYYLQSNQAVPSHLIEGFIEGLQSKRPALFNIYCNCPPEHGSADDSGVRQAKLALESRAYPIFRYNPDKGVTPSECIDIDGNPDIDLDWPVYDLKYMDANGKPAVMPIAVTFADFAVTEARFLKHFKKAPPETWNDRQLPIADFLKLSTADREGRYPFVWVADKEGRLGRLIVSESIVASCEDRRDFWRILKSLTVTEQQASGQPAGDALASEERLREQMIEQFTQSLMRLASGKV